MRFKCQWPGETLPRSVHPLDRLQGPVFQARVGDPRDRIEGGLFGADMLPATADLKGSLREGRARDGDRELPEPIRWWSWPTTWRRLAATAASEITASLIEGLALTAAAEHSELLLRLRDYWSQGNAAKGERGLGKPALPVGTTGSAPVINAEAPLNRQN